jgi:hypothetical protein
VVLYIGSGNLLKKNRFLATKNGGQDLIAFHGRRLANFAQERASGNQMGFGNGLTESFKIIYQILGISSIFRVNAAEKNHDRRTRPKNIGIQTQRASPACAELTP